MKKLQVLDYVPGMMSAPATIVQPVDSTRRGRPNKERPLCRREGCKNQVQQTHNLYCSVDCRSLALSERFRERAEEIRKDDSYREQFGTSEELREAFRLGFHKVPSHEWPEEVREEYRKYIAGKRAAKREERRQARSGNPDKQNGA